MGPGKLLRRRHQAIIRHVVLLVGAALIACGSAWPQAVDLADALTDADQGDLFTVAITAAGVVFADVAH